MNLVALLFIYKLMDNIWVTLYFKLFGVHDPFGWLLNPEMTDYLGQGRYIRW